MIGPNIRFYVAHNVKGIFEEDTIDTADSELATLGGYVMAKCLWNPNYDSKRAIDEFLAAYYGKAAGRFAPIWTCSTATPNASISTPFCGSAIDSPHLNDELLTKAKRLWQEAEGPGGRRAGSLAPREGLADERRLCDSGAGPAEKRKRRCRCTQRT